MFFLEFREHQLRNDRVSAKAKWAKGKVKMADEKTKNGKEGKGRKEGGKGG